MVRKGYLYTIEVLVVSTIILIAIAVTFSSPYQRPATEDVLLKQEAYNAIKQIDANGDLRYYVYTFNKGKAEDEIEVDLSTYLSTSIGYEVEICKPSAACSTGNIPEDKSVFVFDYYLSGWKDYEFNRVRIYLWKK